MLKPRRGEAEQLHQVDAILATEPRLPNGDVDQMVRELCAMHVVFVSTLPNISSDLGPVLIPANLDYAKLQRKMDTKDSGPGPSKLRPKESSGSSP